MPLFPTSLDNITLSQWIDYTNSLKPLDEQLKTYQDMPDCQRKGILLTRNLVSRAFHTHEWFVGDAYLPFDQPCVDDVLKEYQDFMAMVNTPIPYDKEILIDGLKFGQFVDSKMIASNEDASKWETLQYFCAIYRLGKKYKPAYLNEESAEFKDCGGYSLIKAIKLADWFDKLNTYIQTNYTLFQDSGESEGASMKEHMQRWGWINFLKSIAKTKVFDISGSGLNSIDCAREAALDDVLTWASEEKDYNIALNRDMEDSYRNQ